MKILLSVLLLSFCSCAMSQKINGYITFSDIRKAVSASGNLKYDSTTGVFNYVQPVNVSTFSNDAGYLPLTKATTLYAPITHTHVIASVTGLQPILDTKATAQQLKDSITSLNSKLVLLSKKIDSIAIKATTYKDTMKMYVIVTAVKDTTQIPK
jgi:hypothetical protein